MLGYARTFTERMEWRPAEWWQQVVTLFTVPVSDQVPPPPPPMRPSLFSLSDIHGDRLRLGECLRLGNITDTRGVWHAPAGTVLVHTGDAIDRGPATLDVLDHLQALQKNASAARSSMVFLLGNHEVMNLMGDLRYVPDADIESFKGHAARARAFASDGVVGRWLLEHFRVCHLARDTVFVHAGIHPKWLASDAGGCDGLNERAAAELRQLVPSTYELDVAAAQPHDDAMLTRYAVWQKARAHSRSGGPNTENRTNTLASSSQEVMLTDGDGPVWYRGYALEPESVACPLLEVALQQLGARRMVVGHTIQEAPVGRMRARCGGSLVLTDTGSSRAFNGWLGSGDRAAILALDEDGYSAMYVAQAGRED